MTKPQQPTPLEAVHASAAALMKVGAILPATTREFDASCLTPAEQVELLRILAAPMVVTPALERAMAEAEALWGKANTDPDAASEKDRSVDEPDRVARLSELTAVASDALGDVERGERWLRTPNVALDGSRPIDMTRTPEGTRLVMQILGRIDHGIGF